MLFMYMMMQLGIYLWHYNLAIAHLSTFVESLIYLKIFHDVLNRPKQQVIIRSLAVLFTAFALADSFILEGFSQINSYTNLLESTLITGLILAYFEEAVFLQQHTHLLQLPLFVASIGILLYLAGTVTVFLFTNHFISTNDELHARLIYLVSSALVFVLALLLTRAFYLVGYNERRSQVRKVKFVA
jgi:multisubunit Na+/H+ antiporter MnhG subunit